MTPRLPLSRWLSDRSRTFEPSRYQKKIFTEASRSGVPLMVRSVAGSAKTTTLVETAYRAKGSKKLFLAFNKAIVETLKERIPDDFTIKTIHSLGYGRLRERFSGLQLKEGKYDLLCNDWLKENEKVWRGEGFSRHESWEKLTDLVKFRRLIGKKKDELGRAGVDTEPLFFKASTEILRRGSRLISSDRIVDYSDMLYAPIRKGLQGDKFDLILVDEVQDLSNMARRLILQSLSPDGRFIGVGDEKQAIMGFAGANPESYFVTREMVRARELPLSICYRCPTSHLALAQQIVSSIEARPQAPEGRLYLKAYTEEVIPQLQAGDLVICRRNSPVVDFALRLLTSGKPARVRGREVGANVVAFLRAVAELKGWSRPETEIMVHGDELHQRLGKRGKKMTFRQAQHAAIDDRVATAMALVKWIEPQPFGTFIERVQKLFDDGTAQGVIWCSSIHRCVAPGTLVETPTALQTIAEIPRTGWITTPTGMAKYKTKFSYPEADAIKITTRSYYTLTATPNHGITVWRDDADRRCEVSDLRVGDWVRLKLGATCDPALAQPLPLPPDKGDVHEKIYPIPRHLTPDAAEFLGLMVADGTVYRAGFRIIKRYLSVIRRFEQLVWNLFKVKAHRINHTGTPGSEVNSTYLSRWLTQVDGVCPKKKGVPKIILKSSLEIQAAFLRGLFEDGTVNEKSGHIDHVHLETKFVEMGKQVQTMLLRFGIICSRKERRSNGHPITSLYIYSQSAKKFGQLISFVSKEKNRRLRGTYAAERSYCIPVSRDETRAMCHLVSKSTYDNAIARGYLSRDTVRKVLKVWPSKALKERLTWHYERVRSLKAVKSASMCVEVPDSHRFLQNGFDGCNSKGQEAERVVLLQPSLIRPHRDATPDEVKQESNLKYVALTRSKDTLWFVEE